MPGLFQYNAVSSGQEDFTCVFHIQKLNMTAFAVVIIQTQVQWLQQRCTTTIFLKRKKKWVLFRQNAGSNRIPVYLQIEIYFYYKLHHQAHK